MIGVNLVRAVLRVRLLVLVLGVLTVLSWGGPLAAAPNAASAKTTPNAKITPETPEQRAARAQLEQGREQLKQGHAEAALSAFLAARQLDDSLAVETALADATLLLGKPIEARAALAAFQDQQRARLTPEQLTILQAKLAELGAATAALELQVNELDAEIQLDGSTVGHSPVTGPLLANPGPHRISLKKPGFISLSQEFVLVSGANALKMTLMPEVVTGKLRVTSSTQGVVELLLDGQVVGLLPWEGALPVGKVTLVARTSDQTSSPLEALVERDITKPIAIELAQNVGLLEVSSSAGVRISVDGREVGVQHFRGTLPPGSHRLKLERDSFQAQEQDVQVQTGAMVSLFIGHWQPNVHSAPAAQPEDSQGLYFRLDLAAAFASASDGITQHCADKISSAPAHCATHNPVGGSLGLRAGYRFKWIAPELFGLGSFAVSYVKAQFEQVTLRGEDPFYGPARREDYVFFRYGWAAGAGVRVTSPTNGIAATGALGLGVFSQSAQYSRTTNGSTVLTTPVGNKTLPIPPQSRTSSSVHSYAPGLVFDGGVLLGSSPGTKLYLGFMAIVEFAPKHARTAAVGPGLFGTNPSAGGAAYEYGTPGLDVVSGTQYRFGPVLGFQFGY